MPGKARMIAGNIVCIAYLIVAYGSAVLPSVLSLLGFDLTATGVIVAALSLVCLLSTVVWMMLDEQDGASRAAGALIRGGAHLCYTGVIVAACVAAFGFTLLYGQEGASPAFLAPYLALSGMVGCVSLFLAGRGAARVAELRSRGIEGALSPFDRAAVAASAVLALTWFVLVFIMLGSLPAVTSMASLVLNGAVALAMVWLLVRCDVEVLVNRKGA